MLPLALFVFILAVLWLILTGGIFIMYGTHSPRVQARAAITVASALFGAILTFGLILMLTTPGGS